MNGQVQHVQLKSSPNLFHCQGMGEGHWPLQLCLLQLESPEMAPRACYLWSLQPQRVPCWGAPPLWPLMKKGGGLLQQGDLRMKL